MNWIFPKVTLVFLHQVLVGATENRDLMEFQGVYESLTGTGSGDGKGEMRWS